MCAPALIADPTGDTDRKPQLQVGMQLIRSSGEAMGDAARQRLPVLLQDSEKIVMRITLVQEHRLAHASGELELSMERLLLHRAGGEIAKIVEAAFPRRDHLRLARELLEDAERVRG